MKKKRNRQLSKILITLSFSLRGYSWSQTPTAPCAPPWPGTAGCSSPSRSWTTPSWSGSTTLTRPPRSARRLWRTNPLSRSQIRIQSRGPQMRDHVRDLLRILQPWRASRCRHQLCVICHHDLELQATSDPVDQVHDTPPGGIPARNHKGERLFLFVGIIDILQSYRLIKKLEHTFKAMIHDGVSWFDINLKDNT